MIRFFLSCAFAFAAGASAAEAPRVVTDIAPVQSLVARVMEGVDTPAVLLPPGASPHDHALRPSEARSLAGADMVIWVGPELTGWLGDPITSLAPEAAQLVLSEAMGVSVLMLRQGGAFGEHDEDEHDDHDDHDEHEDEAPVDPHMWLDPQNAMVWLGSIAEALGALDPENAASYARNAAEGAAEISAKASSIGALVGAVPRSYLAYHDAFGYAEGWLGLTGIGAIQSGHAVELGPARLAELRGEIAEQGVSCILTEPQYNSGLLDAVIAGRNRRLVMIDPLGGGFEAGPSLYLSILDQFAEIAKVCN
jgi:zinc transport system substrate-binding protein